MPGINLESKNIQMLLTTNSDLHLKKVKGSAPVIVTAATEYRPDKIVGANSYMKADMIAAGIDSPWMLVRGRAYPRPDHASLNREFVAMDEDFHI